jgi:hypothetical protein
VNAQQRLHQVSKLFPDAERIGFSDIDELSRWVAEELGSIAALDGPVRTTTGWKRAVAVDKIYHICAGNLSVAAETSLLISIVLGSEAWFKLPSVGLPELEKRVEQLPAPLRERVHLLDKHEPDLMRQCGAVVVFGSDATVEQLRQECTSQQRLLRYGHKISLGVVTAAGATSEWAQAAVRETLAYQQLGCLSPQSYLCPDPQQVAAFAECLTAAFEARQQEPDAIPFEAQALIFEARQRAAVAGDLVVTLKNPASWTVVQREQSRIEPGPGFGYIEVVPAADLTAVMEPWRGLVSSVSFSSEHISREQWAFWESYGVHRLCRMGNLQRPPIAWPHDGRPRLADLVSWTYADPDLSLE